jgi:putative transposase
MPWEETSSMDARLLLIADHLRGEMSIAELSRASGVSRRTAYKWIVRYVEEGLAGLEERSRAPLRCAHRLDEAKRAAILAVRQAHPTWGPKKIGPKLAWPVALSTIGEVIKAAGLTVPRRRRSRVPRSAPLASCIAANDTWSIDFKGWFRTGDGARCDPLTLSDNHSRYLLRCQAVTRPKGDDVWPILDAAFREFGLPKALRSDNGAPFASRGAGGLSSLSVKLIKAGTLPERIRPAKPQENGRHERMHGTLKRETASPPAASLRSQQRRFDAFRREYNEERPHEALGQTPPAAHYAPSPRIYTGRLREPEYPDADEVRRVRSTGEIKWRGDLVFIGTALVGEPVGLVEIDEGEWTVRFATFDLGVIDSRDGKLRPVATPRPGFSRHREIYCDAAQGAPA